MASLVERVENAHKERIEDYQIYQNEEPYSSIISLPPMKVVKQGRTSCTIKGLTQRKTYYFAVMAVGEGDMEQGEVKTVFYIAK